MRRRSGRSAAGGDPRRRQGISGCAALQASSARLALASAASDSRSTRPASALSGSEEAIGQPPRSLCARWPVAGTNTIRQMVCSGFTRAGLAGLATMRQPAAAPGHDHMRHSSSWRRCSYRARSRLAARNRARASRIIASPGAQRRCASAWAAAPSPVQVACKSVTSRIDFGEHAFGMSGRTPPSAAPRRPTLPGSTRNASATFRTRRSARADGGLVLLISPHRLRPTDSARCDNPSSYLAGPATPQLPCSGVGAARCAAPAAQQLADLTVQIGQPILQVLGAAALSAAANRCIASGSTCRVLSAAMAATVTPTGPGHNSP